jgi:biopolymer transport protein ExbD
MQKKYLPSSDIEEVDEPLINLTPLIDVVFVVLITFMLIAPVLDIDSVDLATSSGVEKNELETSPITIALHRDNSISLQGKKVSLTELQTELKREKAKHPKAIPQLCPDKLASFGSYQDLKNTVESVGFSQMDIVLKPG